MLKVRFVEKSKQLIISSNELKKYYELIDKQCLEIFLPNNYEYEIVDENSPADICIVGIQHTNNNLLRSNELNIFLSVENFSVGRKHYQHFNKFNRYNNKSIDLYLYNDISLVTNNSIPNVLQRMKYFNKIFQNIEIPFSNKKFCLFTSRNLLNDNKKKILNELSKIGHIDMLNKYDDILKNKTCYNSKELIDIYSQYKFIICFENSKTNGYITEKIFNVFLSGSIPIYDGAPNINDFINPNSFLQYDNNIINKINMLKDNEILYNKIISTKKTKDFDYDIINNVFSKLLKFKKNNLKVISFCIYGNQKKYCQGLLENLKIMNNDTSNILSNFCAYIYVGNDVPQEYIQQYSEFNFTKIIYTNRIGHDNMINRFYAIDDDNVEVMIVRDIDSRLHERDIWCINHFIESQYNFHTIRDHPNHRALVLGGLWGVKKLDTKTKIKDLYIKYNIDNKIINRIQHDQYFLRDIIYPLYKSNIIIYVFSEKMRMKIEETIFKIPFNIQNDNFCGLAITYNDNSEEVKEYKWNEAWND
jgi:hypothetical protein